MKLLTLEIVPESPVAYPSGFFSMQRELDPVKDIRAIVWRTREGVADHLYNQKITSSWDQALGLYRTTIRPDLP